MLRQREKMFKKMFADVQLMQIYNLDYLNSLRDLPQNEFIIVAGKIRASKYQATVSDPEIKGLLNSYLPSQPKRVKEVDGLKQQVGKLWQYNDWDKVVRGSLHGEQLYLKFGAPQQRKATVVLFELQSLREDLTMSDIRNITYDLKVQDRLVGSYTEYTIIPDGNYLVCGRVQNDTIIPRIIMGDTKDAFLDSIDDAIITTQQSALRWVYCSVFLLICHFLYGKYVYLPEKQLRRQQRQ
ncbi:hypothetical protein pb186bvf_009741 [Paramecium bursaria]